MNRIGLALLVFSSVALGQASGWKQVSVQREGDTLRVKGADGTVEEYALCGGAELGPDPDAAKISPDCKKPEGRVEPTASCLRFSAKCPSDNATMLVFQSRPFGSKEWTTRAQQCSTGTLTVTGLKGSTDYEVRGRVLCNDGSVSAWTSITDVSTAAPAAPALVLEEAKPTSLILSVRPNKDCPAPEDQRYEVSYAKAGESAKTLSDQIVPFAINGLARGTIYKVRVRVKDGFAESEWSAERELSTAK